MIKLIVFDLDGTLLDTSQDIRNALNGSLKKFGLSEISLEQTTNYLGNGARKLVDCAVAGKTDKAQEVYADFCEKYADNENKLTKLYPHEAETLEYLSSKQNKLAIVTNKPQKATEKVFNEYLSGFGFCKVIGQTADFPLKPDPSSTLSIIEDLGFEKEECVFVGDGETDVATAVNAGIKCVSVLWGYRNRRQLEDAGADIFAEDYSELVSLIESM